jgi:hypothetical protein
MISPVKQLPNSTSHYYLVWQNAATKCHLPSKLWFQKDENKI